MSVAGGRITCFELLKQLLGRDRFKSCSSQHIAETFLEKAKITRIRIYKPPNLNELFNQSHDLHGGN